MCGLFVGWVASDVVITGYCVEMSKVTSMHETKEKQKQEESKQKKNRSVPVFVKWTKCKVKWKEISVSTFYIHDIPMLNASIKYSTIYRYVVTLNVVHNTPHRVYTCIRNEVRNSNIRWKCQTEFVSLVNYK